MGLFGAKPKKKTPDLKAGIRNEIIARRTALANRANSGWPDTSFANRAIDNHNRQEVTKTLRP